MRCHLWTQELAERAYQHQSSWAAALSVHYLWSVFWTQEQLIPTQRPHPVSYLSSGSTGLSERRFSLYPPSELVSDFLLRLWTFLWLVLHSEQRREFKCEICKVSFGLKGNLNKHIRVVHNKERPFECDVCASCFGLKSDLKRHRASVHPNAPPLPEPPSMHTARANQPTNQPANQPAKQAAQFAQPPSPSAGTGSSAAPAGSSEDRT